ncbi:hypothetical protein [Enterobacter asburiae]|uniref:hypothetical protein n=1 Tax=Enterobacter asburiae TaxID=61645 RepID=UPI0030169DD0
MMPENSTNEAINQAYQAIVMQLYNVYLNSADDSTASGRFEAGLVLARQVRDNCYKIAAQHPEISM